MKKIFHAYKNGKIVAIADVTDWSENDLNIVKKEQKRLGRKWMLWEETRFTARQIQSSV